jgi:MFS transporter, DHA3 family, macrolide efflux protein
MKTTLNKNMALLLMGQLVSQVGDKFYLLALSFWVLKTTGSPAKMAVVLACSLFPSLILGFVSGVFIDRYSRKGIIIATDLIRGIVIGFVAAAYYYRFLSFEIIIVSQVLLSVNAAFFDPAIPTIIPQMVKQKNLAKANSMTEFIRGISNIIGPVLGGIAVVSLGYLFSFIFNSVSFLVSAFFEGFLKITPVEKQKVEKASFKNEIVEGYKYILLDKRLIIILIMVAIIHFFVGSVEVIIPVLADNLSGDGARNMGFMQTAFGIGAILMALLISVLDINKREVRFLFGSVFFVGLAYIMVTLLHLAGIIVVAPLLLIFLIIGSFIILAATCFKTLLQKSIDKKMAGRVFGVVSSLGNGSIPFAMLAYGVLLSYIDVYHLLLFSGLALLPLSAIFNWQYNKVNVLAGISKIS